MADGGLGEHGGHEERACGCSPDGDCPAMALDMLGTDQVSAMAEAIWTSGAARPASMPRPSDALASRLAALRTGHRSRRRRVGRAAVAVLRLGVVAAAAVAAWRIAGIAGGIVLRLAAVAAATMTAGRLARLQPPWEAGRRRRAAERRTTRALRQVERAGYLVLRDLVVPGTPVHIGHLVVGATGVWALESRRWGWARALQIRRRRRGALARLRQSPAGRYDPSWHPAWLRAAAATARSTAHAVAEATTAPRPRIRPLLCVHGRMPGPGLLIDGVPVVAAGQLVDAVSRGPLLAEAELAAVADDVMAVVRPAA